jgi:hypothetical protein
MEVGGWIVFIPSINFFGISWNILLLKIIDGTFLIHGKLT